MEKKSGRFLALVALLTPLCFALPVQAKLNDTITVTLDAPGGIIGDPTALLLTSPAPLASGIKPGDGSAASSMMLGTESITFSQTANDIFVNIASGGALSDGKLVTGYLGLGASPAEYLFTGLGVTGFTITGYQATVTGPGGTGPGLDFPMNSSSFIQLLSPTSLSVELDNLILHDIGTGQSTALAMVDIHLITQAVPEPSSVVLALAGLMVIVMVKRAR